MDTPPEIGAAPASSGGGWLWMGALLVVTAGVIGFRYVTQVNDPAFARAEGTTAAARKPVLLMFTADWCGPCQHFKHTVLADPAVAERVQASFTFGKVDLTRQDPGPSEVARSYGVSGIPQLILTDAKGKEIARYSGAHDPREFLRWLDRYMN
jgi:thiol:disulfide interchange protein DsbD